MAAANPLLKVVGSQATAHGFLLRELSGEEEISALEAKIRDQTVLVETGTALRSTATNRAAINTTPERN